MDRPQRLVWPHLGILVCLFMMAVTSPRPWQRSAPRLPSLGPLSPRSVVPNRDSVALGDNARTAPQSVLPKVDVPEPTVREVPVPEVPVNLPLPAIVAHVDVPKSSPRPPVTLTIVDSKERLAMRPSRRPARPRLGVPSRPSEKGQISADQVPEVSSPAPFERECAAPGQFTLPVALLERLDELAGESYTAEWARRTAFLIRQLAAAGPEDVDQAELNFGELLAAAEAVDKMTDRSPNAMLRSRLLRARHALRRRLDLWEWLHTKERISELSTEIRPSGDQQLANCLTEVAALTESSREGQSWHRFLLLGALQGMLEKDKSTTERDRRVLARRVLRRLTETGFSRQQREFVEEGPLAALPSRLRDWAAAPVEIRKIVEHLERYEETGLTRYARLLADDYQSLVYSSQPNTQDLARKFNENYRNANLRIAVSGTLLNRLINQPDPQRTSVRDTIVGADVIGTSTATSRLVVRMMPDPYKIHLGLDASGLVVSDTSATSGAATFYSVGRTRYLASKAIQITSQGTKTLPATAEANGDNDLTSLDTDYDEFPLVRSLVRGVALSQRRQTLDEALCEVEEKVMNRVRRSLDTEADRRIAQAEENFTERYLVPLSELSLSVTPLEMYTTERRLVMRIRLAGDRQLGAHTPRPRAPSDSETSLQLHESAIRNVIERLDLDGRQLTLPELYRFVAMKLGRHEIVVPEDLPDDAFVKFAPHDAIRVRIHNGLVHISLTVAELSKRRHRYRNFTVHASYRPESNELNAQLVRDGIIRLEGRRFATKSQIVLRGVFAKLFSRDRPIPLLNPKPATRARMANLEITQLVAEDGWIGLAIGPRRRDETQIAVRK